MIVTLAPTLARRLPFYYGWVIIGVTGLVSFASVAFLPGVVGALFTPMSEHFGWSRAVIPGAVLAGSIMVIVVAPVFGRLVDRYGARPVITGGALVMGLCLIGLGFTNSAIMFYAIFGLGFSMFSGVFRVAMAAVTAQWFVRRRGLATSFISAASALGFVFLPPIAVAVTEAWGWRAGWMSMGIITLVLAVPPSILFLLAHPSQVGQRVDGDRTEEEAARTSRLGRSAATEVQWTVREAIRTPTLWVLLLGLSIQGISSSGANVHLIPHFLDQGLSASVAVIAFVIGGVFHFITAFFWGPLSDRIHIRYVFALSTLVLIAFVMSVLFTTADWMVIHVGLLMGVGFGGNVLVMRVAYANYFGRRSAGAIQGFVAPFQVLVAGSGALLAGVLYDAGGSYLLPFFLFAALMAFAIVIVLVVPEPVKQRTNTTAPKPEAPSLR